MKKVCVSLGSDAISFKSSSGAQAMPTENMLIPLKKHWEEKEHCWESA